MSKGFGLDPSDVVSLDKKKSPLGAETFRVGEVAANMAMRAFNGGVMTEWSQSGVECEVLRIGKGWQKGRVRFSLEFLPDEPEEETQEAVLLSAAVDKSETQSLPDEPQSPLDDLRAELNLNNG